MEIHEPGLVGVMGPSGSGKSTLLHLLGGLDRPDSGQITVGDARVDSMDENALTLYRRRGIGIIFQQFNLLASMTALENVLLPGVLDGSMSETLEDRARSLLEDLGVGDRSHHRPDALSGGEQQRVGIARAVVHKPRILLADEPTGNLDPGLSAEIMALFRRFQDVGVTVLIASHDIDLINQMNCRIIRLEHGMVADDGGACGSVI